MKRLKTRRLKGMIRFARMVAGVIHVACPSRETGQGDYGEHEADKAAGGLNTSKSFNGIMGCPDIIIGKIHGEGFSIR
jgi:hypothetical protein